MPFQSTNPKDGSKPKLSIILGYGDIGVGLVAKEDLRPDTAAVGLVPLEREYGPDEKIENWNNDPDLCVYLMCYGERGLASLRRIVKHMTKELGYENKDPYERNEDCLGFDLVTNLMDEVGALKLKVKDLEDEIKERDRLGNAALETGLKKMVEETNVGSD